MRRSGLCVGLGILLSICFVERSIVKAKTQPFQPLVNSVALLQGRSEISGTVFGESHRPLADVYVELLDDVDSTIRRAKTTGSGRFEFGGLVNGRYIVKVLPYGTDYSEQSREVTIAAVSAVAGSGSDRQIVDFVLK